MTVAIAPELPWKCVWITGASQGIGRALALELAAQGVNVAVSARNEEQLKALELEASSLTGDIKSFPLDVLQKDVVAETVRNIESSWGEIDVAILNAGTYIPIEATEFSSELVNQQLELNVMGVCHGIEALLTTFLKRNKGHIAINASLAGYRGLPKASGYGASKAALINLSESLSVDLENHNIRVQVINPGFVKTPLTDQNTFHMPFLISSEQAAQIIVDGLQSGCFEIRFPRIFAVIMGVLRWLPFRVYKFFIRKLE